MEPLVDLHQRASQTQAQGAGLVDTVVVNTCAVTAEAVRQARQAIRKARRERPHARIVVTGCAAQTEPETFARMGEIDRVIGNDDKLRAVAWADARAAFERADQFGIAPEEKIVVNDIMAVRETAPHLLEGLDGLDGRARAMVQVQNGCDHRCTFCIIPYGRGPSRSVPAGEVVAQVRKLVANGYAEIVLTGVDITAYGADLPGELTLGRMVIKILKLVPELKRLRLSSIDSVEADGALLKAIAEEERLMPHLHLSLQAGHDLTLKRMKRRHSRADAVQARLGALAVTQAGDPGQAVTVHFGQGDFTGKYRMLAENFAQWQANAGRVESIDLQYSRQVVVNPDTSEPVARRK
jgi:threonylcarbamoyladenosine tRNA methylthiotransferase MtaB